MMQSVDISRQEAPTLIWKTTPVGFEPTRGDPSGLAGRRLNRSAKVSYAHADSQRTLRS